MCMSFPSYSDSQIIFAFERLTLFIYQLKLLSILDVFFEIAGDC